MKIGFVGLGEMGFRMACCLLKAGFEVIGYDVTKEKEDALVKEGGQKVNSLAELGQACETIVACLTSDTVVRRVLEEILKGGTHKLRYFIDCSTIGVPGAEALGAWLKEQGIYYFDSPVSGGPGGAETGTLTIMVGGDEGIFNNVLLPVYQAMGKNIPYFGGIGSGQKIKLINQILVWSNYAVICEAAVLAKKANLDEDKMYDCLMNSYGASRIMEVSYKSHIQPENYSTTTGLKMLVKDMKLAQKFAQAYGAKLPMTDEAMKMYNKAMEELGDNDGDRDGCIIMEQLK